MSVRSRRLAPLPALLATLLLTASPAAAGRHVAVILDTSGSMQGSDPPRYTMQLSQILADLLDTADRLSIVRMPGGLWERCSAGPSSGLVLKLDPADRAGFKRRLDGLVSYDSGTHFAAPIRTAISLLPRDRDEQRLLLVIADAGGLGSCSQELTRELLTLKASGATIAAINLGGTAGAFDQNPAFDFTTAALDAQGLIEAVAMVYQRFLGAKKVQTGRVQGSIEVEIAPFVEEAFLVVAADGPIRALSPDSGNPSARGLDLDYRGGGETTGLDQRTRGYRIARLERPTSGRWTFAVPGLADTAGWMLLQDSSIGVRLVTGGDVPRGVETALGAELFDQRTGQRIGDTSQLPGLQLTLDVDGKQVTFRDDGTGGDRQRGDGVLTGMATFDEAGEQTLAARLESDFLDRRVTLPLRVVDASWRLAVKTPPRGEVDSPLLVAAAVEPFGRGTAAQPPERVDVLTGGAVLSLRDDGQGGDRTAGDRIYARSWTPTAVGKLQLDYSPVGGSRALRASAPLEVLGRLAFGRPPPVRLGRAGSGEEVADHLDLGNAVVKGSFEVRVSTPFELARSVLEIDGGAGWVPLGAQPTVLHLSQNGPRSWPVRLRVGSCPPAWPAGRPATVVVEATGRSGQRLRTEVPLAVEVIAEPWLRCWWPLLAAAAALLFAAVLVHGLWSPSRFAPGLVVMFSTEEDMSDAALARIRAPSGFYRDAQIYVRPDYRLSRSRRGTIARLRAAAKRVRIQPTGGPLWRQNADGEWEQIPPGETAARFGDLYRNDLGNLFFQIRNQ